MKALLGKTGFVYLLLFTVCVFAYLPGLNGPFIFDDVPGIVQNPAVSVASSPGASLTVTGPSDTAGYGRPLVAVLWWIQYQLGNGQQAVFHGVSLLLHLANCILVLMLLRRMLPESKQPLTNLIGFLWAMHPLLSEAVLYASQQTELLVSLMILGTLNASIRGHKITAVLCCILGIFCKELMVVTPLLVFLAMSVGMDHSYLKTLKKHKAFHATLWSSCLIAIVLMTLYPRTQSTGNIEGWNNWNYLLTQTQSLNHYLVQTVWPTRLAIDLWFARAQSIGDIWSDAIPVLLLLATCVLLLIMRHRSGFWLASFFIILAPTSSFIPITTEIAAERRMYLPLLGLLVFIVFALHHIMQKFSRPNVTGWLLLLACLLMPIGTFQRAGLYQQPITLYKDTVAKFPDNRRAVRNLGSWYFQHQQYDKALQTYDTVLKQWPGNISVQLDRAITLAKLGQPTQAIAIYEKHMQAFAKDPPYLTTMGDFYRQAQQWDKARLTFLKAIKLDQTNSFKNKVYLASVCVRLGDLPQAIHWQLQALENSAPIPLTKRAETCNTLGMYYGMSQQYERAQKSFTHALSWPNNTPQKTLDDIYANLTHVKNFLAQKNATLKK